MRNIAQPPALKARWLGIAIDTVAMETNIPLNKVKHVMEAIAD